MDFVEALSAPDYEAIAGTILEETGLPLLQAVSEVPSRGVDDDRPDGIWHLAALRHNTLTLDAGAMGPIGAEALSDGSALRAAMVERAERGTLTLRRASRALSDPGYLIVRPDGAWRSVVVQDQITLTGEDGASTELALDLFDRVERAAHRLTHDAPFAARVPGAPAWLVPSEPAMWEGEDAPAIERLFPSSRDTVLSFASDALPDAAREPLEELTQRAPTHAAGLVRAKGKSLIRTLYVGDFAQSEGPTRIDIVMLMHQRIWAARA